MLSSGEQSRTVRVTTLPVWHSVALEIPTIRRSLAATCSLSRLVPLSISLGCSRHNQDNIFHHVFTHHRTHHRPQASLTRPCLVSLTRPPKSFVVSVTGLGIQNIDSITLTLACFLPLLRDYCGCDDNEEEVRSESAFGRSYAPSKLISLRQPRLTPHGHPTITTARGHNNTELKYHSGEESVAYQKKKSD